MFMKYSYASGYKNSYGAFLLISDSSKVKALCKLSLMLIIFCWIETRCDVSAVNECNWAYDHCVLVVGKICWCNLIDKGLSV